ncbi:MAG: serine/threonine-protein kinase [Coleofasciculus sp. B1-GNL1-01]|uniref:serine/threonine protein kinase n=1 Tax=Coleofasciculus sp. B1-GNL1-01 TaxID=3068484 RepID=UPI0032F594A9
MVEQVLKERYQIQKQLGQNGGRQTLLARDLQTQELVAIKILTFGADFHWDDLKLFEREAQTLQSLSHRAIPHYLDSFKFQTSQTKGFALVQSYIEAKSLAEWVKLGRTFNEDDIKHIAKALLEILMYLHAQHPPVIHRDIKPSNILLANRSGNSVGQVYLVDFGSVQTLAATEGSTITVVGTYGYMPPEQFGGRAVPASDLYSLGAMLIYLVTGMHPADLPQEDLRIQFEPKIPLDSAFVDWLKRMTEPDLNRRLTSANQGLKSLKKQNHRTPIIVTKPTWSQVKINNNKTSIEVIIPDHNTLEKYTTIGLIWIMLINYFGRQFYLFFNNFSLILNESINVFFQGKLLISFIHILFIIIFCITPLIIVIKTFTKSTILRIDQHKISLNKRRKSPRKAILKLGFFQQYDTDWRVRRNIRIWAGTRQYNLPTEHLTDKEIDWIAHELSE